ncbi:MAG TPA: hypothetical protein VGX50_12870 [Longimicrobium sp.]|nr:hypothetical protein [Longimicrobium sp.]
MPQDHVSGAAGAQFGHECAPRVMEALGARPLGPPSNKCVWKGKVVVVKCAQKKRSPDPQIGVLTAMLPEVESVVGVFQNSGQEFAVMEMPVEVYRRHAYAKAADEKRAAQHMMKRSVFTEYGEPVRTLVFDPPLRSVE